ncbi:hypothetical protein T458_14825 [Brevibacillus panacihumi W25]|uniref:Helicase ATP-binding domain-containing protein n=1 Tax=Brevibacillus panacihumi W25 TaxID=1408254 RepID=V6M5C4_9BACL|nr:DEAD/DEAH box helicase family protein [Brevibacillus panacihumi]EST53806.1 hypothetical protein T458_14825 [Brevibacillus panacihumi W25]
METIELTLPAIYTIDVTIHKNKIRQLLVPEEKGIFLVSNYNENRVKGYLLTNETGEKLLAITNSAQAPESFEKALKLNGNLPSLGNLKWIKHPSLNQDMNDRSIDNWVHARNSWVGSFLFKSELKENGYIYQEGLRPPQIGAIHATLSHWIVSDKPATIVMPTGTGKTETMLGLLVANKCRKLLVVVPTDPLRNQIAEKFIGFGVLKQFGVISDHAHYPVVGVLMHKPKTFHEVDDLFSLCNVVITTMSIAGGIATELQDRMASHCSHLFIDEAHHIAAPTWANFRGKFKEKHIVQFTATPFRNDGKHIDGKVIFNYPLEKAQREGYFRKINFYPVLEFSSEMSDKTIAERAVEQLRNDLKNGYDHLLSKRLIRQWIETSLKL